MPRADDKVWMNISSTPVVLGSNVYLREKTPLFIAYSDDI